MMIREYMKSDSSEVLYVINDDVGVFVSTLVFDLVSTLFTS